MPLIIQKEWYVREEIQQNPDTLYVFGDNLARRGTGGQARACRGEPNAIGVVTKSRPSHDNELDYLNDKDLGFNCHQIITDFAPVIIRLRKGGNVVYPADGIGTGLAKLKEKAPLTFEFLQRYVDYVKWVGEQYAKPISPIGV